MKKYEMMAHVSNSNGNEFLQTVSDRIHEYQEEGLTVEVQYQATMSLFSAVIFGCRLTT